MKKYLLLMIAACISICSAIPVKAETTDFSYYNGGDVYIYGTTKAETYDVAVLLNNPNLVGTKITGLEVAVPEMDGCYSDPMGWLTTELKLKSMKNLPNICSVPGIVNDNVLSVSFPEPYEITEEGVYVGYSLTITSVKNSEGQAIMGAQYPVTVFEDAPAGSLYLHSTVSLLKWTDINSSNEYGSTMIVKLEGDFSQSCAYLKEKTFVTEVDKEKETQVEIVNVGASPISDIDYTYTVNGESVSSHVAFENPICPYYGTVGSFSFPLPVLSEVGTYPISYTIDKINGVENTSANKTLESSLIVSSFTATYRPLVEEYTGLWCGYCPRGYVAMEEMNDEYGDDFVGVAYHNGDPMSVVASYPSNVGGFPFSYIDRTIGKDPSYLPKLWPVEKNKDAFAEINATIEWADEEHTALRCTSTSRFVCDYPESNYAVEYILIADGLRNNTWEQENYYYSLPAGYYPGKYWSLFLGKGSSVKGLYFNDVVAHCSSYNGVKGSLPSDIKGGEEYTHVYDIPVEKIGTKSKTNPFTNYDLMRVVAIIVDSDTRIPVNCVKSDYLDFEAKVVAPAEEDVTVVATTYFDLQGRSIAEPAKGFYIKSELLDNGTTRVKKIMK